MGRVLLNLNNTVAAAILLLYANSGIVWSYFIEKISFNG